MLKRLSNPFIPNTLSHRFFDCVRNANEVRTAKHFFNQCGAGYENAGLANMVLENMAYLFLNVSRPGKSLRLSDKIRLKPLKTIVNMAEYAGQLENSRCFLEGMRLLREAKQSPN